MLQWRTDAGWNHRAYWGENLIEFGLEATVLNGMAFTLYDGSTTWDYTGLILNIL